MLDLKTLVGGKRGLRKNSKKGIARQAKDPLRLEAETRQAKHNALTIDQKIAKLDKYGFIALKERNKLAHAKIMAALTKK